MPQTFPFEEWSAVLSSLPNALSLVVNCRQCLAAPFFVALNANDCGPECLRGPLAALYACVCSCPPSFPQTPRASPVSPHVGPPAVAETALRRPLHPLLGSELLLERTVHTLRAVSAAARAVRSLGVIPSKRDLRVSSAGAYGHGQALDGAAAAGALAGPLAGVHAVVDGEVAADHVGFCGGAVLCQGFALVGYVG